MRFLIGLVLLAPAFGQTPEDQLFRKFFERLRLPISGNLIEQVRAGAGLTAGEMDAVRESAWAATSQLHPYQSPPGRPTEREQQRTVEAYVERIKIDLGPVRFRVLLAYVRKTEAP